MALVERPTALLSGLALHPEDLLVRLALELADLLCVAGVKRPTPGEARFWGLAEPLLEEPGITRSTMMGFPCLRIDGKFFASCDHRSGALVVKLPESRVDQLVEAGRAESFAPAGRPFREWASISPGRFRIWRRLLAEALEFVASQSAPKARARKPRGPRR